MALTAALVVAASACGGEDDRDRQLRRDYQSAVLGVVEDASAPISTYTSLVVGRPPEIQCESLMRRFEKQVDDLVERVAALRPPEGVEDIHDDFVVAARESVDRVGEVREEVESGELSCGRDLNDALYGMPSSDRAERAIARLEQSGIHVYGN